MQTAKALQADEEVIMAEAELARSAAFIMTASEGGNHYLPALRQHPEQFEPHSRERLLAGAMLPGAWYVQAQRFRRHVQQQILPLFDRIMYLNIDDETILERIKNREENDYGQNEFELKEILARKRDLDEKYSKSDVIHIDAGKSLNEVADQIISYV
jgi:hypothetical protein